MKKYAEVKKEIQAKYDAFPFMFAFSNAQFEEGKKKLGVTDNSEMLDIGVGMFIRKIDREAYRELIAESRKLKEEYLKDPAQLKDAFIYELGNHEYIYTGDYRETLESLGLVFDELTAEQKAILREAKIEYMEGAERE